MSNRNRTAGHNYERQIIKELKEQGYEAISARLESKRMDDAGIDIVSDFPHKIQCKLSINQPNVHQILTEKECDVIFFKKQEKANTKFVSKGEYVMMTKELYYEIMRNHSK